jgi:hypothetical protein
MEDPNELIKTTILLPRYAKAALREEAFKRGLTQGEIVLEALTRRIMLYTNKENEK